MMNSNTKRKNRSNATSKPSRPKGPLDKNVSVHVEGVYSNARFMHGAASLVGCIVQVQAKDGKVFEGVFKTFSPKMELVLVMPYKVDMKSANITPIHGLCENLNSFITNYTAQDFATEKLIFNLEDVVMINAVNVDLDYATRGFTDSSISKFNGQVFEKELEPWEGPLEGFDGPVSLDSDKGDTKNGWDANEMFRTNAEKYGVTSTYDCTLQGYTVPLEPKNTEEYKKQEAKAMKIAQEIESSQQHRLRIALENGDEEERYSAVMRPSENTQTSSKYVPPQRRRNIPVSKPVRNVAPPSSLHSLKSTQHSGPSAHSHGHKSAASSPSPVSNSVSTPPPNHGPVKLTLCTQSPVIPTQQQPVSPRQPHHTPQYQESKEMRVNGGKVSQSKYKTEESRVIPPTENKENIPSVPQVTNNAAVTSQPVTTVAKPSEKKKDQDRKGGNQKGRDEQLAEFKKFSSDFRLMEEPKEQREQHRDSTKQKPEPTTVTQEPKATSRDMYEKEREKIKEQEKELAATEPETTVVSDNTTKSSNLNPNAKEFTLNPNAKSFTPRTPVPAVTPPTPATVQQHRMHTQSPVVALPQQPMMLGMGQPAFTTMQHQYLVSSPGNMSLTPQFPQAVGVSQGQRFRKTHQIAVQQRHDIAPSVHVAAATGQPILAPAAIPTPPQLTMPYSSQGMMPGGGPQPGLPYAQIYSVLPQMMSPQPVGMVPTSHTVTYGEYPQMTGHVYMSPHMRAMGHNPHPHGVPVSAVQNMLPQASSGPHSAPSTPQSQTPGTPLHAPSPVHQQPAGGPHVTPAQTPTPTGQPGPTHTPQPVVYSQMMPQPSMQPGHHNPNTSQAPHLNQNHPHPHHNSFSGTPQSMILMSHTPHHSVASSGHHALQGHPIHGHNPGNHAGTPTHVIPHMPMNIIPTSGTMGPTPMVSAPFVAHPQGTSQGQPNPVPTYPHSQ
ncbi:uncharacterized protein LOC143239587 isoform X1 [Tachypleus tridentatus]|uniref:uncharacterized protein LOC143239587 isoform X1 n=1 Tax=Tachypleus tridentatus TaxID=6853 RepID=UPI003FD5F526